MIWKKHHVIASENGVNLFLQENYISKYKSLYVSIYIKKKHKSKNFLGENPQKLVTFNNPLMKSWMSILEFLERLFNVTILV